MIIRFERNSKIKYGWVVEDRVRVIEGDVLNKQGPTIMTGLEVPLSQVQLLPPCVPSKVICIGRRDDQVMDLEVPDRSLMFLKPSTSVIGPKDKIIYPRISENVHAEGQIGIVIKRTAKHVKVSEAEDYVLGYTGAIDVTVYDIQSADEGYAQAKSFDSFCQIGPGIVPKLDWNELYIEFFVNGMVKQKFNTKQLIFGVPQLIEEISKVMTLLPGDVILTGTPSGVGPIAIGDQVEVRIEGIPLDLFSEVVGE